MNKITETIEGLPSCYEDSSVTAFTLAWQVRSNPYFRHAVHSLFVPQSRLDRFEYVIMDGVLVRYAMAMGMQLNDKNSGFQSAKQKLASTVVGGLISLNNAAGSFLPTAQGGSLHDGQRGFIERTVELEQFGVNLRGNYSTGTVTLNALDSRSNVQGISTGVSTAYLSSDCSANPKLGVTIIKMRDDTEFDVYAAPYEVRNDYLKFADTVIQHATQENLWVQAA